MKRLFDAPAGRCMLHTWGGEGWQFIEVTVFRADGFSVREEMGGGARTEPYASLIHRLTGLELSEAEVLVAETTARWRDSGEEAEQGRQGRSLLRLFKGSLVSGVSIAAAVAGGAFVAGRRRHAP